MNPLIFEQVDPPFSKPILSANTPYKHTSFLLSPEAVRGCSVRIFHFWKYLCIMGLFSVSDGFQNSTGKGRGGAMPLHPD